ncbi:hypothetical protein [Parvularcula maris]|uniref:PH domain-containing protein n=1 Tax=Parvularcula maris TaxID=2965077 RepID=A0A9X2L6C9_9PROT|nr:hypothetical protein [Parvularcula maris]MCQ8183875.1 hypothetical protein [Parvularcula maris]
MRKDRNRGKNQDEFERFLDPGELILWRGEAGSGVAFSPFDAFLIPFALVWTSVPLSMIGLTSTGMASQSNDIDAFFIPFTIVPLLFVIFGCYLLFGRFLIDMRRRSKTSYALTNDRALIFKPGGSLEARAINPSTELTLKTGRKGSLTFGSSTLNFFDPMAQIAMLTGQKAGFVFERIDDAEKVYRLVRNLQKEQQ